MYKSHERQKTLFFIVSFVQQINTFLFSRS